MSNSRTRSGFTATVGSTELGRALDARAAINDTMAASSSSGANVMGGGRGGLIIAVRWCERSRCVEGKDRDAVSLRCWCRTQKVARVRRVKRAIIDGLMRNLPLRAAETMEGENTEMGKGPCFSDERKELSVTGGGKDPVK